jgi:hypothetical protein
MLFKRSSLLLPRPVLSVILWFCACIGLIWFRIWRVRRRTAETRSSSTLSTIGNLKNKSRASDPVSRWLTIIIESGELRLSQLQRMSFTNSFIALLYTIFMLLLNISIIYQNKLLLPLADMSVPFIALIFTVILTRSTEGTAFKLGDADRSSASGEGLRPSQLGSGMTLEFSTDGLAGQGSTMDHRGHGQSRGNTAISTRRSTSVDAAAKSEAIQVPLPLPVQSRRLAGGFGGKDSVFDGSLSTHRHHWHSVYGQGRGEQIQLNTVSPRVVSTKVESRPPLDRRIRIRGSRDGASGDWTRSDCGSEAATRESAIEFVFDNGEYLERKIVDTV